MILLIGGLLLLPHVGYPSDTESTDTLDSSPPPVRYQPDPLGQRSEIGEITGVRQGYVHPFASIGEYFTDNLFNREDDRRSEFITVISPGIWLAFPASREQRLGITTMNRVPGGLAVSRFRTEGDRRLQAYALYRADIREHRRFSEENSTNHRAEGNVRFNLRGGLSVDFLNIYQVDHDAYGTGISRELDRFTSNLFSTEIRYRFSPKLAFGGEYAQYQLDYREERNQFREREDQAFSAFLLYRFLPKTSLVLEYRLVDIDYDVDFMSDSREQHYLGGMEWIFSEKTRGGFRLGYGIKDFDAPGLSDQRDFIGEAQLNIRMSPIRGISLRATRRANESDIPGAGSILSRRFLVGYAQRLGARISGSAEVSYRRDDYREVAAGRQDDYYGAGITIGYAFRTWLNFGLGYSYVERSSSIDRRDYRNNTAFITVTAAI
jgi:polysaccharide biosynthesis protein VpsM